MPSSSPVRCPEETGIAGSRVQLGKEFWKKMLVSDWQSTQVGRQKSNKDQSR